MATALPGDRWLVDMRIDERIETTASRQPGLIDLRIDERIETQAIPLNAVDIDLRIDERIETT
jgi:hypothetical protein